MRITAAMAALWFAMAWFGWEILASLVDVPRSTGPVFAGVVAVTVVAVVRWQGRSAPAPAPTLERGFRPAD